MRWAFPTEAFGDISWVAPWAAALSASGLPGKDFLVMGVNATLTEWSSAAAQYADLAKAYTLLLCLPEIGLTVQEAKVYTVHGLKHWGITAATQLDFPEPVIEQLGHWVKGSKMPRKYNQAKAVRECGARAAIV
jgi:hypothetical protein